MLGLNMILHIDFPDVCGFGQLVSKPQGRDNRSPRYQVYSRSIRIQQSISCMDTQDNISWENKAYSLTGKTVLLVMIKLEPVQMFSLIMYQLPKVVFSY